MISQKVTENILIILIILISLICLTTSSGCNPREDNSQSRADAGGITRQDAIKDNLEDMYHRIYGEDAVFFQDDLLQVDLTRCYKDLASLKIDEAEARYKLLLKQASEMESAGNTAAAVEKLRRSSFIENHHFKKPGLGTLALERIHGQTLDKARSLEMSGNIKEALRVAEIAVACNPSNPDGILTAGRLFAGTGQEGLAIPYLRTALDHRPDDIQLKYRLQNLYVLEGKPEGAIPLITRDMSRLSRFGTHFADLAQAYLVLYLLEPQNTEVKEKVKDSLAQALAQRNIPREARTELFLSEALFDGDFEEALKILRDLEDLTTSPALTTRIIYNRGLLHLTRHRREQGSKFLQDTVRRAYDNLNITQGENYMALMSAWGLDVMGEQTLTPSLAEEIFTRLKNPDFSYRQEYNFIQRYLEARQNKKYKEAAKALEELTEKRHLKPVGDFVQDILQVPAEKGLVYISMGEMYERAQNLEKARESFSKVKENLFFGYRAKEHLNRINNTGRF